MTFGKGKMDTSCNTPGDRLLISLVNSSQPLRVSELKRAIGDQDIGKKELNQLLYGFQERGLVERTVENPPLWSATVAAASIILLENSHDNDNTSASIDEDQGAIITQEEQKVVSILMEEGKEHGISAGSLAAILGKSIAATNKILYGLEKNTKNIRRSRSNPPIWKILRATNDGSSAVGMGLSSLSYSSSSSSQSGSKEEETAFQIGGIPKQKRTMSSENQHEPSGKRPRRLSSSILNLNIATELSHQKPAAAKSLDDVKDKEIKKCLSKIHDPEEMKKIAETVWARMCSDAVWKKYRSLNRSAKHNDIVAGFIVLENSSRNKILTSVRVVAFGSGTKCVGGDQLSCDGTVIHDSHAEVVARRSLIRWIYSQIKQAGQKDSLAIRNKSGIGKPFQLRPFELWFYTSQTPCGDSAVYSYGKEQSRMAPCWQGRKYGCFRIKLEAGQGTTVAPRNMMQSIDGLRLGDRMMHNSCSDKMAKWSALGIQGALLSRLIDPIYIKGIVVGAIFSHGHICRALCCRSDYALKASGVQLPKPFGPRHPHIRHAELEVSRSDRIKKKEKYSYNWAEHDLENIEVIDGRTGQLEDSTMSRICKHNLFCNFIEIHSMASQKSYSENKALAVPYQTSKKMWKDAMRLHFGHWMDKPCEVDDFSFRKQS